MNLSLRPLAPAMLVASAALSSCSLVAGRDPDLRPIEGPVIFSNVQGDEGQTLYVRTEEWYGCPPGLVLDTERRGERLRVEVLGLYVDEARGCPIVGGPASRAVPPDLAPGTYTLKLAHLGHEDEYRLTVREDTVLVETVRASVSRYDAGGGF